MASRNLLAALASGLLGVTTDAGNAGGELDRDAGVADGGLMGSLPKHQIKAVIQGHVGEIRRCYEPAVYQRANLAGRVVVEFTIEATGAVSERRIAESTLNAPEVEACMLAAIGTWVFPKPTGAGQVFVTYPWTFRPNGGRGTELAAPDAGDEEGRVSGGPPTEVSPAACREPPSSRSSTGMLARSGAAMRMRAGNTATSPERWPLS